MLLFRRDGRHRPQFTLHDGAVTAINPARTKPLPPGDDPASAWQRGLPMLPVVTPFSTDWTRAPSLLSSDRLPNLQEVYPFEVRVGRGAVNHPILLARRHVQRIGRQQEITTAYG
jgi:hypothetical protein